MNITASKVDKNSLQAQLEGRSEASQSKATTENIKIAEDGINTIFSSGIMSRAKHSGDAAPDFTLFNATGIRVTLSEMLKESPVVLTWYRGGWCPYCNITLKYLQGKLGEIKAEGGTLIALTPESPDHSLSLREKHQLQFEILSDTGNNVARDYGIVYKLSDDVAKAYQEGFDLHAYNGDESHELPLAATYVIDQDGMIRYTFLSADYKKRAEPTDILAALKQLKK